MRKLTPIPPAATINPVYLMAAAINSLIQTLPLGTAYCIGIVFLPMTRSGVDVMLGLIGVISG